MVYVRVSRWGHENSVCTAVVCEQDIDNAMSTFAVIDESGSDICMASVKCITLAKCVWAWAWRESWIDLYHRR